MIQIEVNRWTIKQLELALEKYNAEHENFHIHDYVDIINTILGLYLKDKIME